MNCPHCATPLAADARFCPACGQATAPTESGNSWPNAAGAAPDLVGKTIAGRYRIVAKLGEGGMGAVYRGEQMSLKRAVAVKLLRPELSTNQMILQRFNAEAQAVAKLSHPNTVNIYDFGQDTDGSLFIAMEFIEGRSLRDVIQREGPFPPARALQIASQVAASLSDAHSHSIVHRDLKPDNVMLQDRGKQKDVMRVLDFGIAKLRDDSRATQAAMTQAGDMLGTPQYMAPEQIKGEAIDGRTDVYALGCMIYEMVTARLPFEAPSVMAMLSKHLMETPPPPSQRRPELRLPPQIDQLVMSALAKEPRQRPPTMDAYAEMISGLLATMPGDPNRSAPMSIQQAAVAGAPMPSFAPPSGPAFTPVAPSAFAPPSGFRAAPQPQQPHHGGYVPPPIPPTLPVGGPPAARPYTPPTAQLAKPKSNALLFVIVGVIAFGGAGVGVWLATKDKKNGPTEPQPGSATPDKPETPETPPDPDKPDPWQDKDKPDPWASQTEENDPAAILGRGRKPVPQDDSPPVATTKKGVGTAKTPLGSSAYIAPPDGFSELSNDAESRSYINTERGLLLVMAPLDAGTNDPKELAAGWTKATGATLVKSTKVPSHGAPRDAMIFSATYNGVPVVQIVALYITDRYRIGVLMQAPIALFGDTDFQNEVDAIFEKNVHLP